MPKINANGVLRDMTPAEEADYLALVSSVQSAAASSRRVSRMQAIIALKRAGKLNTVRQFMNGLADDDERKLAYEGASHFERGSATMATVAQLLNFTPAEVDALFDVAETIKA